MSIPLGASGRMEIAVSLCGKATACIARARRVSDRQWRFHSVLARLNPGSAVAVSVAALLFARMPNSAAIELVLAISPRMDWYSTWVSARSFPAMFIWLRTHRIPISFPPLVFDPPFDL